jgi:thiosulfate/3-mercaptopyruvate sulfurtransferase
MTTRTFTRLSAAAAWAYLRSASEQGRPYCLFDTRDAASYAKDHLPGAQALAERDIGQWISRLPHTQPILIYCYHGNASQGYAKTFADFGFSEVYSIDGGFQALMQAAPAPLALNGV